MKRFIQIILIFVCSHISLSISLSISLAKDYVLFKHGEFSSDYNSIMEDIVKGKLIKGDQLIFTHTQFTVDHYINKGGTTVIVAIGDKKVLRIPKSADIRFDGEWGEMSKVDRDYLKDYVRSNATLRKMGVPVIQVDEKESLSSKNSFGELEYVLAEEVQVDYTFAEFSQDLDFYQAGTDEVELSPHLRLNRKQIRRVLRKLQDFIKATSNVVDISDLHMGNLAMIEGKWVALDYGGKIKTFFPLEGKRPEDEDNCWREHVLRNYPLPPKTKAKLEKIVKKLRQEVN